MTAVRRFVAGTLLALGLAPAAHAGDELYLRWDNCIGDGGVYNKTFACDTNSGIEFLVGSFRLAATDDSVVGLEITLDLQALGPTMPSWWSFLTGGCRPSSLHAGFTVPPTSTVCLDPWAYLASGGVGEEWSYGNN